MRLKTPVVQVGNVKIGGSNPVVVQSMTNTDTADAEQTAKQCIELFEAGSELVRITVNNSEAALSVPKIRQILEDQGYRELPLIGDFHFNGHKLLADFPEMAKVLDKYRINPGNVGRTGNASENFKAIIEIAAKNKKPVRIGVNWGSLDQELLTYLMDKNAKAKKPKTDRDIVIEAMVESAIKSAKLAENHGMQRDQIILSVKMSQVDDVIKAYKLLVKKMKTGKSLYALHLGLTEAGSGSKGLIASSAALSVLLYEGIGDTIRISLTPAPGQPRAAEVEACKQLLQSLNLRHFKPQVTSCPGCGRTDSSFFLDLAKDINSYIDENKVRWIEKNPKVSKLKIAVMGCIVNGPGESKHADIAISLPGRMEKPLAPVYIRGKLKQNLTGDDIPQQFIKILEDFLDNDF